MNFKHFNKEFTKNVKHFDIINAFYTHNTSKSVLGSRLCLAKQRLKQARATVRQISAELHRKESQKRSKGKKEEENFVYISIQKNQFL
jgi:hypothetical protein